MIDDMEIAFTHEVSNIANNEEDCKFFGLNK